MSINVTLALPPQMSDLSYFSICFQFQLMSVAENTHVLNLLTILVGHMAYDKGRNIEKIGDEGSLKL